MKRRSNKLTGKVGFQERRENAMRPSGYLGYDHDELGVYFLDREAFVLAEVEFRRAVWLNPYEPQFRLHLAAALMRNQKKDEARRELMAIRDGWPNLAMARVLLDSLERSNKRESAGVRRDARY